MNKVAVLGSGLLGGSIALAAQCRTPDLAVSLWGRRQQGVDDALAHGVKWATTDMKQAVEGADLIILSTPVGAMLGVIEAVSAVVDLKGVLITDVGSVKLTPREVLKQAVQNSGAKYIGSHPMAGSEQAGVSAAKPDLFEGAACVLTNDFHYPEEDVARLWQFWESLGCVCHLTTSEDHDRVMARISHLPHLLASVGAMVGLKHPEDAEFAGNGMRDTTRVASGHPEMWAEILRRNRSSMKEPIEEAIQHLQQMLTMLEAEDEAGVTAFLQQAKSLRDKM